MFIGKELEQINKTNQYLSDLFWKPLRDLSIKRNGLLEDETGKRKFKKIKGYHRCVKCREWKSEKKMDKSANNWYCIYSCLPKIDRRMNNGKLNFKHNI